MRSQLAEQFMPFFWLIAHILTFCDKKYRILMFRDKKYRILMFCDKTKLYLTVLQQNNAEACKRCEASLSFVISLANGSLCLFLALSGSLGLSLAHSSSLRLSGSLRLSQALSASLWLSLALAALLLRYNILISPAFLITHWIVN